MDVWNFDNGQLVRLRLGKRPDDDGQALAGDHKVRLLYTRRVPAKTSMDDSKLAL